MITRQPSKLLPYLFEHVDEEQRLTVLHIGPALPETVNFFSRFRCRLIFADLFAELPIDPDDDPELPLTDRISRMLAIPDGQTVDICLFWDLFNFLDAATISALVTALRPHLHPGTRAHGFALHNVRTADTAQAFAIDGPQELVIRPRNQRLPGYAPHPQNRLKELLNCFEFVRSVLLADSRLELALTARS